MHNDNMYYVNVLNKAHLSRLHLLYVPLFLFNTEGLRSAAPPVLTDRVARVLSTLRAHELYPSQLAAKLVDLLLKTLRVKLGVSQLFLEDFEGLIFAGQLLLACLVLRLKLLVRTLVHDGHFGRMVYTSFR